MDGAGRMGHGWSMNARDVIDNVQAPSSGAGRKGLEKPFAPFHI